MAKRSKKIEKETRRLIESISDLVRKKDNQYKFRGTKKKEVRQIKRTCVHWIIRKGKEYPAVEERPESPGFWTCKICGKNFRIKPFTPEEYHQINETYLSVVNQCFFYSVKMGGDASDTKVMVRLKELVPKFDKISRVMMKQLNKRQEYEDRRRQSDQGSQFGSFSSFNYRT